jgi:hypothetical protein
MSLVEQYMDPRVFEQLDPKIRIAIERQVKLGVKQVEVKLANQRLELAKADLRLTEKQIASGGVLLPTKPG